MKVSRIFIILLQVPEPVPGRTYLFKYRVSTRITAKIEQYASDPKSLANNVKILTGSQFIRLRVADWRFIMDDQGSVLEVIKIGARGSIYE